MTLRVKGNQGDLWGQQVTLDQRSDKVKSFDLQRSKIVKLNRPRGQGVTLDKGHNFCGI